MINARQLSLPAALSALIVLVTVIVPWIPNVACSSESTVDPPVLYSSALSESSLLCLLSSLSSSVFFCQGTINSAITEYLFVAASQLVFWEEQVCLLGWKWCKHFLHLTCSSLLLLCRELSVLASSLLSPSAAALPNPSPCQSMIALLHLYLSILSTLHCLQHLLVSILLSAFEQMPHRTLSDLFRNMHLDDFSACEKKHWHPYLVFSLYIK